MKNKILLLLLTALAIASCSGDPDTLNSEISNSGLLILKKVETFYPSAEAYSNPDDVDPARKKVQYFENGEIVADTVYDKTGALYQTTVRTASGTTKTETVTTMVGGTPSVVAYTYTYDAAGRITEYQTDLGAQSYKKVMAYNTDGTIVITSYDSNSGNLGSYGAYSVNPAGRIANFDSDTEHLALIYQDSKPIQYTKDYTGEETTDTLNFTYYSTAVPVNRVKTITQVNNIILISGYLYYAAYNAHEYLESHQGAAYYADTFNNNGYLTVSRVEQSNGDNHEMYYYYNE